jgi:hypothetical protein
MNRHTELFYSQVRGSQYHNVVAHKTREVAEIQGSTASLNAVSKKRRSFIIDHSMNSVAMKRP